MKISGVVDKIRDFMSEREKNSELTAEVDDKRLVSLQRMRQKQINETLKKRLQRDITSFNKKKFERAMGFSKQRKGFLLNDIGKNSVLRDKRPLLKEKMSFK